MARPAPPSAPRPPAAVSRPAKAGLQAPHYRPGLPITDQGSLDAAFAALHAIDPAMIDHLAGVGGRPPLRLREPGFAGLAAIVTGQQVSTASARAIFGRLEAAVSPLTPEGLLASSDAVLRAVGLSAGKVVTLRAVASAVVEGRLPLATLAHDEAEAAHAALVAIRGIGPWTADSFLLFCLGHADAWPAGDLALQEAARIAFGRAARPGAAEMHAIGERWRPYRGVAARLLWAYYAALKQGRAGMILAAP